MIKLINTVVNLSIQEVKLEWGKGLAQKREAEARQEELELEKAKPFARTRQVSMSNNITHIWF